MLSPATPSVVAAAAPAVCSGFIAGKRSTWGGGEGRREERGKGSVGEAER
jgi:hypothetical protein